MNECLLKLELEPSALGLSGSDTVTNFYPGR